MSSECGSSTWKWPEIRKYFFRYKNPKEDRFSVCQHISSSQEALKVTLPQSSTLQDEKVAPQWETGSPIRETGSPIRETGSPFRKPGLSCETGPPSLEITLFSGYLTWIRVKYDNSVGIESLIISVADPDQDPPGSTTFGRIRPQNCLR